MSREPDCWPRSTAPALWTRNGLSDKGRAIPRRLLPGERAPLRIAPIFTSYEAPPRHTGLPVQVLVRDNNVDQALKALKKKMQREGIFREMKLRGHYEKPSEKRAREKAEAVRRARKLARKKLQREGLLPMKPKPVPGAPRSDRLILAPLWRRRCLGVARLTGGDWIWRRQLSDRAICAGFDLRAGRGVLCSNDGKIDAERRMGVGGVGGDRADACRMQRNNRRLQSDDPCRRGRCRRSGSGLKRRKYRIAHRSHRAQSA